MAPVQHKWLPAPVGGEGPSLPPDALKENTGRRLRNFLVHNPGRITPRGSIGGTSATLSSGDLSNALAGPVLQAATFEDTLFVNHREASAAPLVDHWRIQVNRPQLAAELAQPYLHATVSSRAVDLNTGTVTDIGNLAATSHTGISIARLDDALYGVTYGGASTAIPGGVAPLNNIRKQNALGNNVAVLTNGPRFVQAVIAHHGRIFAAAARRAAGADYDVSQVFYTIAGGTTAWTNVASDWQDPVTGESQRIQIGAANDGDFVVGFGRANGHLVVFKRYSVWILYGTAPSNFTLRQLRTNSGCVDLRSISIADEGTYFASQLGYELFDGNSFKLVSAPVADEWLAESNAGVAASTVNYGFIRADPLPNGYLHLTLGADASTAGAVDGTKRAWLFHRPTASWSELRTGLISQLALGAEGCLSRILPSRSHLVVIGAAKWAKANGLTYGVDPAVGLVDRTSAVALNVELRWTTRLVNLVDHWTTATLHALTMNFRQRYMDATAGPPAWATISAVDGSGVELMPATNVEGFPNPGPLRARPFFSRTAETDRGDVTVTVTSTTGATQPTRQAELSVYGLGVAYTPGRERHVS